MNVLATGGGTSDRHIRIWNVCSGACLSTVDAHSQVRHEHQLGDKHLLAAHTYTELLAPHAQRHGKGGGPCSPLSGEHQHKQLVLPVLTASSQVCSILWSTNYKEFVSGHGFAQNQLVLWKYPTMTKVAELQGRWTGPGGGEVEGSCNPWFEPAPSLIQDSIQGPGA